MFIGLTSFPLGCFVLFKIIEAFKGLNHVSLLTLSGRVLVPFRVGSYQEPRMRSIKGQADLMYRNDTFSLAVTLEVPMKT
ncbi:hypothetical protein KSC_089990 [Ktedonobacter sp. SOSP1-52]|nr:hypothetical protein KSC_089990 [Ktedonobacter sp. SOSP1-52]